MTSKPHSDLAETVREALVTLHGNTDPRYSGTKEAYLEGHAALDGLIEQLEAQQRELDRWRQRFSEFDGPGAARAELERLRGFHRAITERTSNPASSPLCPCGHPASSHPAVWSIAGDATTHCNECECRDYDGEPT